MLEWNSSRAASRPQVLRWFLWLSAVASCRNTLELFKNVLLSSPLPLSQSLSPSPSVCLPAKTIQSGASVCVCPPLCLLRMCAAICTILRGPSPALCNRLEPYGPPPPPPPSPAPPRPEKNNGHGEIVSPRPRLTRRGIKWRTHPSTHTGRQLKPSPALVISWVNRWRGSLRSLCHDAKPLPPPTPLSFLFFFYRSRKGNNSPLPDASE